jgi:hypothetical protein
MKNINCTQCEASISPLAEFPGGICVDCYSIEFDKMPIPTANELADMFRNSVN